MFKVPNNHSGFTLAEMMVGIAFSGMIFGVTTSMFFTTSKKTRDFQVISETEETLRSTADMIAFDLRMAGSGVPLGQANFSITDATLGDAPYPILLDSTDKKIHFRINEKGISSILISNYTPGTTSLNILVLSGAEFKKDDTIYIADAIAGGNTGMKATINSISGNTITIKTGYQAPVGATFKSGATVNKVSEITYEWAGLDSIGVTRNNGSGSMELVPNSTMSLEYFDTTGNPIALPLTVATLRDSLGSIRVKLEVRSEVAIANDHFHTALSEQDIWLRNLTMNR